MSEERKVSLTFVAENQTKGTLQEIKTDVTQTAAAVEQSGQKAGKGIEAIGNGSDKAAAKLEGATRSIIGSIQRTTAAAEAGEKGTAKYFETLGRQRGISSDALAPYLAQLRQVEAAQAAAASGFGNMTMSAKATAAAMRQVPAQFQDIVVSLQGGQQPLTVLLQQGSQLSTVFGGAGAAAKALGGYILGLINPYTVLAATVATVGVAYYQGSKEQDAFSKAIIMSGNASGVTASQLREYARQIDSVIGTQAQAAAGLAAFTAAGVRGGDELRRYTQTAIEWERATGQSVEKTAEQFASLQKDPLAAVLKLNEGTNFLTLSVYEQIKALEDQGKKTEAAEVAMGALDTAMRERGRAIQGNLGYIERGWKSITGAAKEAWDAMLNVGRAATSADTLASVRKELFDLQARSGGGYSDTEGGAATGRPSVQAVSRINARIAALKQEETQLVATMQADEKAAASKAESARVTQAKVEWDKKGVEYLNKSQKMERELTQARNEATAAGVSGKELEERLAGIREKYTEKTQKGADATKAAESAYKSLMTTINEKIAAMEKEGQTGDKLTETEKQRIKYQEELSTKGKQLNEQQRASIEARLKDLDAAEKQAIVMRELKEAREKDAKVYEDMVKKQETHVASINASVAKMKLEEEGHLLAAAAGISHAEAMERITIARLEDSLAQAQQGAGTQEEIDRIQREITARKELLTTLQQRSFREANKKVAEDAAKDWDKTAQTISRTLSDYIMSGGKDAATYLKRLFANLVLEPSVQGLASGFMTGAKSAVGSSSTGSVFGSINSVQSLWSAYSGGLTGSMAAGVSSLGSLMGSSFLGELGSGIAAGGQLGIGGTASLMGSASGTTGIGMALGAAAPWIAGAAALYSIIDSLDNSGTPHMGAQAIYQGGVVSRGSMPGEQWQDSTYTAVSGIAMALGQALDGTARAFGKTAGYSLSTTFADDSSSDGAFGALNITGPDGKSLVDWSSFDKEWGGRWFSDGEAGYKEYLATMATDVKSALQAMDLPAWSNQILASANDLEALNTALQQISTVKAVFDSLGHSMTMFADLSGSVQTTLLNVSGGIDALSSNAQSFYANYFSEQERLDATVTSLTATFAKYGATLPVTAEQYRALVEQQMAAGDAGAEFAAVLLGLNGTFKGVADSWKTELDGMTKTVGDFFTGIKDDIASVMAEVAGSRKDILRGTGTMTAAEIQAAIGNALVYSPSMANVAGAQGATATASSAVAAAKAKADASAGAFASRQGGVNAAQAALDAGMAQKAGLQSQAQALADWINSLWDGGANSGYSYGKRKRWSDDAAAQLDGVNQQIAAMGPNLDALRQALAQQQAAAGEASTAAASDAQRLAAAQAALAAAQKAEVQAKADYAAQMRKFVADAGTSVGKLSDLRGEVVDFYEAQAQAVQGMLQSAGNLRSVVDSVRLGQLTTAQTAAELGNRYALDYALALSTTGSTRAGYVDAMAGNLQGLSEAMKAEAATSSDWKVQTAKLLAQATNAAGMLEGDANTDDYKDVSLGLLDSIDKALESLNGMTKTAEQVIADAVNSGSASNLAGLRAIVAALQGQTVPAFASGGVHLGGLRIVGENGPELEATGPSRIWNQRQLAGALGGGGNSARTEQLLLQLIEEQRVQASRQVDLQLQLNKQMQRWDAMGMPETRVVTA